MNKTTQQLFFISMIIILGLPIIAAGVISMPSVFNWLQTKLIPAAKLRPIYSCPDPQLVSQQSSAAVLMSQKLAWKTTVVFWQNPNTLRFSRAELVPQTNILRCYYQQITAKPEAPFAAITQFNSPATQRVKPYGAHWEQRQASLQCGASTTTACRFSLDNTS